MGKVSRLEEFNERQLERYFGVPPEFEVAVKSMRLLSKIMAQSLEEPPRKKIDWYKQGTKSAIEEVELRYNTAVNHIEKFFPEDYDIDYDALFMALIFDNHLSQVNAPKDIENEDGSTSMVPHSDGFDEKTTQRALAYRQIAHAMCAYGLLDDEEELQAVLKNLDDADDPDEIEVLYELLNDQPLEIVYLAHVFAWGTIKQIEANMPYYERMELEQIKELDLPPIRRFLHSGKTIGDDLQQSINLIEADIERRLNPPVPAAVRQKPKLFIVPPPAL